MGFWKERVRGRSDSSSHSRTDQRKVGDVILSEESITRTMVSSKAVGWVFSSYFEEQHS